MTTMMKDNMRGDSLRYCISLLGKNDRFFILEKSMSMQGK